MDKRFFLKNHFSLKDSLIRQSVVVLPIFVADNGVSDISQPTPCQTKTNNQIGPRN